MRLNRPPGDVPALVVEPSCGVKSPAKALDLTNHLGVDFLASVPGELLRQPLGVEKVTHDERLSEVEVELILRAPVNPQVRTRNVARESGANSRESRDP